VAASAQKLLASGDILITKAATGAGSSYVLSKVPNPAQIRCRTYDDAAAMATRWALWCGAAMWFRDESRTIPIAAGGDRFEALLSRIQGEYLEMPGLQLTRAQAQRLWTLDIATCASALEALVARRFLVCDADRRYRRATDGAASRASSG
jgi:hypothetical protein